MKHKLLTMLVLIVILAACSSNDSSESESANSGEMNATTEQSMNEQEKMDMAVGDSENAEQINENSTKEKNTFSSKETDRKIIYNAHLSVRVKSFKESVKEIQNQVNETGGYIVSSHTYGGAEGEPLNGEITARIPQEHFHEFLDTVERGSIKVHERSVSGKDVTEEFIDLESRLKSKKVVEARLLEFMEKAEKTEDLLRISDDLAKVQGEIEQITGRMNYLQNKADLATVTINISESKINVPSIKEDDLNTWERTKKLFMESVNFILSALSGIFVFIAGSLPILLILAAIGLITFRLYKRKMKKKQE
jgi:major membrane immunogen (membrane-anchored lipoprotein)